MLHSRPTFAKTWPHVFVSTHGEYIVESKKIFMHEEQIGQDALRGHHAAATNTPGYIWLLFAR